MIFPRKLFMAPENFLMFVHHMDEAGFRCEILFPHFPTPNAKDEGDQEKQDG
jgi:hypothetical protein